METAQRREEETVQELSGSRKQSEAQLSELRQCLADARVQKERAETELEGLRRDSGAITIYKGHECTG